MEEYFNNIYSNLNRNKICFSLSFIAILCHGIFLTYDIYNSSLDQIITYNFNKISTIPSFTVCASKYSIPSFYNISFNDSYVNDIITCLNNNTSDFLLSNVKYPFKIYENDCLIADFLIWKNCNYKNHKFYSYNSKKRNTPSICQTFFYRQKKSVNKFETKNHLFSFEITKLDNIKYVKIYFHDNYDLASDYLYKYDKIYFGYKYDFFIKTEDIVKKNLPCINISHTDCILDCIYEKNQSCIFPYYIISINKSLPFCDNIDKNLFLKCFKRCDNLCFKKIHLTKYTYTSKVNSEKILISVIKTPYPKKTITFFNKNTFSYIFLAYFSIISVYFGNTILSFFIFISNILIFIKNIYTDPTSTQQEEDSSESRRSSISSYM